MTPAAGPLFPRLTLPNPMGRTRQIVLAGKTSSTDMGEGPVKNLRQRVLLVGQGAVEIMDPEILEFGIE